VFLSGGFALEALSHRGERAPPLLLCPPHPSLGMSMDAPVLAELAFAASRAGHATLRFNYRGAGASQGPLSDRAACLEDARAAAEHLRLNAGAEEIAVAGYDFGAEIALELARELGEVARLVLIAPVSRRYDYSPVAAIAAPVLIAVGARDELVDYAAMSALAADFLEVIPEADHVFSRGLTELGRLVARFLAGRPRALEEA
jgi:uncharacterized protein